MTDTTPAYTGPQRVFSGIQPTANLHLRNYLGALKKFADLQAEGHDCVFCVVDLHSIRRRTAQSRRSAAAERLVIHPMPTIGLSRHH